MISPSDPDYKETKLIKQGKKPLSSPQKEIVEWANATFGAKILNAYCDMVKRKSPWSDFPRLGIFYEYESDTPKFKDGIYGNFNKEKQEQAAEEFRSILKSQKIKAGDLFSVKSFLGFAKPVDLERLFVYFGAFEPVAKWEANERIPKKEIEELKVRLKNDELWTISPAFGTVTFFFYTDEQVKAGKSNGWLEKMRDAYFDLLTQYDEFKYFDRKTFSVALDSKENFDKNYESNCYYYYK